MKKLLTAALFASLSLTTVGCIQPPEDNKEEEETECFAGCEEPDPDPDPRKEKPDPAIDAVLEGIFISGHLGSYWDCPDQGYSPSEERSSGESSGAFAGDAAPCAEGEECTYDALNCEDGQLMIRLTNVGAVAATGLQVTKIELFDADGVSKATLPLMSVEDSGTMTTFDGEVDAGAETDLRILFQGPVRASELLKTESEDGRSDVYGSPEGRIEITIEGDNHDAIVIEGEGIYDLPPIAT